MTTNRKPHLSLVKPDTQPGPTIDEAVREFMQAKAGKSQKTIVAYFTPISQYQRHAPFWPPTPEAINSFLQGCKARGLSEATLNGYYKLLKVWLSWLVKRGWLDTNPILLAERPPVPKIIPRAPKSQDIQKLFDYLEARAKEGHWLDLRSLAIWSLALDTGLRLGEIAALTIDDVSVTKKRFQAFIRGRKTHTDRVVIFDKKVAKDLKRWLKARAALPLPLALMPFLCAFIKASGRDWSCPASVKIWPSVVLTSACLT